MSTAQLNESEISALSDAKRRLLARISQLTALRTRAKTAGNTKLVTELDKEITEANSLKARLASVETMVAPFIRAWEWAKKTVGLSDLGLVWVPVAVTAGISAVVYAINVFDRKIETAASRYEAELKAVQDWKAQGLTTTEAVAQVNKTGAQISQENTEKAKAGLLGGGLTKVVGWGLLLAGGWWGWNEYQKRGKRAASN